MIIVDDSNLEWTQGMTLADLIEGLENTDFCAAVRMNGKLISSPRFKTTSIPDESEIYLLPLIAGG